MTLLLMALLFQSIALPPRAGMENPSAVTDVPKSSQKDYNKLWTRFLTGKEDAKVISDADKLLKKQKTLLPVLVLEAYIELYRGNDAEAERKFNLVLAQNPAHRIALYYTAELVYSRNEFARANDLYARLLAVDKTRPDLELKRQKSLLLATDDLLRNAARAEGDGRLPDAEGFYRQALEIAPEEPVLHERLAALLIQQKKWDEALTHLRSAMELEGPAAGSNDAMQRSTAEALMGLGRAEEARKVLDTLRQSGARDEALERQVAELADLGRWGSDIARFRAIRAAAAINREQFAAMLVRYFPQMTELRQIPQVITDIQASWALPEIQTVVGTGLLDLSANHAYQPVRPLSRSEFAVAMARLSRLLSLKPTGAPPIPTADLTPGNVLYREVQLVLDYGLMTLDDAGNFGINGMVSGEEAVNAVERLLGLLHA